MNGLDAEDITCLERFIAARHGIEGIIVLEAVQPEQIGMMRGTMRFVPKTKQEMEQLNEIIRKRLAQKKKKKNTKEMSARERQQLAMKVVCNSVAKSGNKH